MSISFHMLCLITSLQLKGASNIATLACSSPHWGKMWFFHHSPSGCRSLVRYHRSSLNPSITTTSFPGPLRGSSTAIPLPSTCSLSSTNCPLPSNNDNLEDWSITTTIGPSFISLGRISKLFPMLPLSSINTTSLHFMIFFVFKHISLYAFIRSPYPRNTHLIYFASSLPLFSFGTVA